MTDTKSAELGGVTHKAQSWLLLSLLVLVGAFLRFHMLGVRSLWPAECFSIMVARQPWPQFLRTMWWGEGNMAFYYVLLRGWLLFGDSEIWLQSLSALVGVMAIPAIYALGSRFLGRNMGLIAAALLAIHSFHIDRSEVLRSYSLLTLLVILSTYAFLSLLDSPRRKDLWALYVIFSALALYAQTFAIFLLAGQWVALLPGRFKRLGVVKLLGAAVAIGVLTAPLLAMTVLENKGQLDWVPRLTATSILNVVRGIVGADTLALQSSLASAFLMVLYGMAWVFAVWESFRTTPSKTDEPDSSAAVPVLAWTLAFPVLAMTAISLIKPILYPRFLLMCVPAAVLLAGQGLVTIYKYVPLGRLASSVVLLLTLLLGLASTRKLDTSLPNSGLDWRATTNYILSRRAVGDAVIFYNFGGDWTWDYYVGRARKAGDNGPTPPVIFPLSFDRASIVSRTVPYQRVWLVLQQDIPNPQSDANTALLVRTMQEQFHLVEEKEFPGETMYPGESVTIHVALYAAAVHPNSP
jgi:4-amino-4-deoxy-L-arabinose transferase-like glycosyltransferase